MAKRRLVELVLQGKDETKAAFASADKSLKGLGGSADGTSKAFGGLNVSSLKAAAGVAAVGAAVVAAGKQLYGFVSDMAAAGDELEKLGQRTGFAVEQLSEFRFLVERSGGSAGDMETAVRRLAQSMGDARDGVKEASDAFARLGLSADDLVGADGMLRSIDEVLPLIADGLQSVQSQADRMDIAQALLGRGGTKLLPALQEGAEGIREMREEMQKYGGAMSQGFADKSAEFVDAQTNLATATSRLKEALSEPFLEPFTAAVNKLAEAMGTAKGVVADDAEAAGTGGVSPRAAVNSAMRGIMNFIPGMQGYAQAMNLEATLNPATYGLPTPGDLDNLTYPGQPGYLDGLPSMVDPAERGFGSPTAPKDFIPPPMSLMDQLAVRQEEDRFASELADSFVPVQQPLYSPKDYAPAGDEDEDVSSLFVDISQDITSGLDEVMNKASDFDSEMASIGENFAANFSSGVGQAFAQAIVYAEDFGDVMGGIFKQLMAQLIQQVVAAGLNSIFPGLGLLSGDKSADGGAVASDQTKGGLPPSALADIGRTNYYATATYAKGYV